MIAKPNGPEGGDDARSSAAKQAALQSEEAGQSLRWLTRRLSLCQAILASSFVVVLAACGGGSEGSSDSGGPPPKGEAKLQIVSFGDSLSDVGTYEPIARIYNGGRFTTNPGQVWVQNVAQHYSDTVTAAFTIDLTQKLSPAGGYGYAEGGATVATPAIDNDFLLDVIGNVEMPLTDQVSSYLQAHGGFTSSQLVLVWAGANDVLRAGSSPGSPAIVMTAANALAAVLAQIVQNGATHVVVLNMPDIGITPQGLSSVDGGATLTQYSQLFNTTLSAALVTNNVSDKLIQVDAYTWLNQVLANYKANGFVVSNTAAACNPNTTPHNTALLCSPSTFITANADQTYMFADPLHLTTRMHSLLAQYVEQQIAASGLGD